MHLELKLLEKKKKHNNCGNRLPAAAGAGTQAKYIAKNYNLIYLDTGKYIA